MSTKSSIYSCQRMSRADMAAYFNRSIPWVDKACKKGAIPPPIKIGAPFWLLRDVEAWVNKLSQEAMATGEAVSSIENNNKRA